MCALFLMAGRMALFAWPKITCNLEFEFESQLQTYTLNGTANAMVLLDANLTNITTRAE